MAFRDHTAHARLLVRNEPKSKSTSSVDGTLFPLSLERERRLTNASRMAGTALAVAVIEGILEKHSAFKREQKNGESSGFLPLNPVQLNGLNAAIYFLHHYVDTLTPEPGG